MAYAPPRSDLDRYIRPWLDAVLGRPHRGNTARRCGLVSARCEALAWGNANDSDDAYRHPGTSRWKGRGLDGEGQRRAVPGLITKSDSSDLQRKQESKCKNANSEKAPWRFRLSGSAAWK